MNDPRTANEQRKTRIQQANEKKILDAALDVFSRHGYRGSTIDQISEQAGISKSNLLYYFKSKQSIHETLLANLLDHWLDPLNRLDENGDPLVEILNYVRRKIEMTRDYPRETRLFANEIIQGAPRIKSVLEGDIATLLEQKTAVIGKWMAQGKIRKVDPRHLMFSIWATTQHYADFDVQVRLVLGENIDTPEQFEQTRTYLIKLFSALLTVEDQA